MWHRIGPFFKNSLRPLRFTVVTYLGICVYHFVELTVACWFLSRSQEKEIMKEIMDNGPVQGMDFSRIVRFVQHCEPEDKQREVKHSTNDC